MRIAGFTSQGTFVREDVLDLPAASGGTTLYSGTEGNACFVRFKRNASQTGGAEPIAYLSYDPNNSAPGASNAMPIYDGDAFWIWPEEIRNVSAASSDANQPTVYYALWTLK